MTRKPMLLRFGLLTDQRADAQLVYGLWRRVCEDSLVVRRSMAIERKRKPFYEVSVLCSSMHAPRVIAEMSSSERQALRERVGV